MASALDQAAPLQGWDLPEEFATLRRLMEARMNRQGRREYVQVLRLLEAFELADLRAAVIQALRMVLCLRTCHSPSPENLIPVLSTNRCRGPDAARYHRGQ